MNKIIIFLLLIAAAFTACQKENYLIDGGKANPQVNMTTYDYLKSNPLFDTLVILIDKAGLKDKVNGAVTFMVPTDYSVRNYVNDVLSDMRVFDPLAKFTINDIPVDTLKMLQSYLLPGSIVREGLTKEGKIYTALDGSKRKVSLEPRNDYPDQLTDKPEYVFFHKQVGTRWDDFEETDLEVEEKDITVQVRTSGIISKTGVIHVLQGNHKLFFYEKQY